MVVIYAKIPFMHTCVMNACKRGWLVHDIVKVKGENIELKMRVGVLFRSC